MKKIKSVLDTISTIAVISAAAALMWNIYGGPKTTKAAPSEPVDVTGTITKERLRNVMGSGPIAIIEFSDFECPYCARHATTMLPALKTALVDTGKVRYAVVNLPLPTHKNAIAAAEAAECAAEQGKYWEMRDSLFEHQQELATLDYLDHAGALGLDVPTFDACRKTGAALERVVADRKEAERLKVRATPSIFLGRIRADGGVDLLRKLPGAMPAEAFVTEVTKLVSKG